MSASSPKPVSLQLPSVVVAAMALVQAVGSSDLSPEQEWQLSLANQCKNAPVEGLAATVKMHCLGARDRSQRFHYCSALGIQVPMHWLCVGWGRHSGETVANLLANPETPAWAVAPRGLKASHQGN